MAANLDTTGRGWKWVRDADGRAYRVPDPDARELMRLLLNWRELGWTWAEITSEVERMGSRSPHKRPYCERTLKRQHAAAQRLLGQESRVTEPDSRSRPPEAAERCARLAAGRARDAHVIGNKTDSVKKAFAKNSTWIVEPT